MTWQLVAAVLEAGIARDWRDALAMPADVATALLNVRSAAHVADSPAAPEPAVGKWQRRPDGSAEMRVGSMEQLAAAIQGFNSGLM